MKINNNPSPYVDVEYEYDRCLVQHWADNTIVISEPDNPKTGVLTFRCNSMECTPRNLHKNECARARAEQEGTDCAPKKENPARRKNFGVVAVDYDILPEKTSTENEQED